MVCLKVVHKRLFSAVKNSNDNWWPGHSLTQSLSHPDSFCIMSDPWPTDNDNGCSCRLWSDVKNYKIVVQVDSRPCLPCPYWSPPSHTYSSPSSRFSLSNTLLDKTWWTSKSSISCPDFLHDLHLWPFPWAHSSPCGPLPTGTNRKWRWKGDHHIITVAGYFDLGQNCWVWTAL